MYEGETSSDVLGGAFMAQAGTLDGGNSYRVRRQRTEEFPPPVPLYAPPSVWGRIRVSSVTPNLPGVIGAPVEVYFAPTFVPCSFDGPAGGSFLGVAQPNTVAYFNAGPLIPGQTYYCFVKIVDDMSYITPGNLQMAWADNIGCILEVRI